MTDLHSFELWFLVDLSSEQKWDGKDRALSFLGLSICGLHACKDLYISMYICHVITGMVPTLPNP